MERLLGVLDLWTYRAEVGIPLYAAAATAEIK